MRLVEYFSDLLGKKYFVDEALVVGPYPTADFFKEFRGSGTNGPRVTPRSKLTILADDGWDQNQLLEIRNLFPPGGKKSTEVNIFQVAAARSTGLVHAKIYFFKLQNADRTYSKRILLVGSANASVQGFGTHAETFVSIDLADLDTGDRLQLLKYLEKLEAGRDAEAMWFGLGRNSWISLPSIRRIHVKEQSGFDSWLRRGRLCHEYRVDPRFGQLSLKLLRPLGRGVIEMSLNNSGFGAAQDTQTFSRSYISRAEQVRDEDKIAWRKLYFIETYYGYWVSAECFKQKEAQFVASRAHQRRATIQQLKESGEDRADAWLDDFEAAIHRVARALQDVAEEDLHLADYFHVSDNEIDIARYRDGARGKLRYDKRRAQDPGFASRFISGFSFPRVPQLGDDFEAFALDFCQSLSAKLSSRTVHNRVAKALNSALQSRVGREIPEEPQDLLDLLRCEWDDIGTDMMNYHQVDDVAEW